MGFYSLSDYLRAAFGGKVYKIALSTGFTCPNRDGSKGTGGCIFCSGAGEFAETGAIEEQIKNAKKRVAAKLKSEKNPRYIAYFQSFSNTYGPIQVQKKLFTAALSDPEVVALSVATRPDCLPEEVLELLSELNEKKPVWVEMGLQTANEKTAAFINRCFTNEEFARAVNALNKRALRCVAHLILGLPGEGHRDEIETAKYISALPVWGVKIHLLHVLRGTRLERTPYLPLSMEEYTDRCADLLRYLREDIVIHRLTGDGDKKTLVAPLWSADKKRVYDVLMKKCACVRQGEAVRTAEGAGKEDARTFRA